MTKTNLMMKNDQRCPKLLVDHRMFIQMSFYNKNALRECTSLLLKARSLPINCKNFETVSQGSRHRSNHTQKNIPSVVAGHQFLQSGYIGQDTGIFPITKNVIHPGFCLRTKSTFQQILFSPNCLFGFAACLWHLLYAKVVLHFSEDLQMHLCSCCLK